MTGKWLFGLDWPGRRCGAKTRKGTPCQRPALFNNARCQLHGGRGGAPCGGRNGNFKHGKFTKEARRRQAEADRRIRELAELGKRIGMIPVARPKPPSTPQSAVR